MKKIFSFKKVMVMMVALLVVTACDEKLTEINVNPNGIDPSIGNVNQLMPSVLGPAASNYLNLGMNNMAGAVQHTQKSGWGGGHNYYEWTGSEWTGFFSILRTNELLINNAREKGYPFHEGVGLTMRAFLFGQIADYWGDAPYTNALKGNQGDVEFQFPQFDSQETIYMGILEDLKTAASLFASNDNTAVVANVDLYFKGDMAAWERFANSLQIRYYVRISEKKPNEAKAGVEAIVSGGKFIQSADQDATMDYTGGANDFWPLVYVDEASTTRYQSCATLIQQLNATEDPRRSVWFAPAQVRWVAEPGLGVPAEDQMLIDGVPSPIWPDWIDYLGRTETFTRRYDPSLASFEDNEYVGIPAGIIMADNQAYNGNPAPGQGRHNIHVSMLTETFMYDRAQPGDLLQSRLLSAAEMHFTLAEMALMKGWSVGGNAQTHYEAGILNSLNTWGVDDQYDDFLAQVPYDGTQEQIVTQKWVASFTSAAEAWNDYKRTGFPVMEVADGAFAPVPAIRFGYGSDELNNNTENVDTAIDRLEITDYSGQFGKDSPYSKQWLLQGTGKPW